MNIINCLKKIGHMQCAGCPLKATCMEGKDLLPEEILSSTGIQKCSLQKKEKKGKKIVKLHNL